MSITATSPTTTPLPAIGEIAYEGVNKNAGKKALDSGDFMKLMITQLSAQDPSNPMKDTEFISQMANFSALEQSKELTVSFAKFTTDQSFATAANFLGKQATVKDVSSTTGSVTGTVEGIVLNANKPAVVIGGKTYDTSLITSVGSTTASVVTPAAPTT